MGDFSAEFVNVFPLVDEAPPEDQAIRAGLTPADGLIADALAEAVPGATSGTKRVLYFPPGTYRLQRSVDFDPSVELYFSPGATLLPMPDVKITIRGRIRAGLFQIFGLLPDRQLLGFYPRGDGLRTVPQGTIRLWSKQIDEVAPEWWGTAPLAGTDQLGLAALNATDSWDSLQAAITAACADRVILDGSRVVEVLPPLPVRIGGIYQSSRTLVARPGPGATTAGLVLRGTRGLGSAGDGLPSIFSLRRPGVTLGEDQWTLLIEPGVDFELSDLILTATINVWGALGIKCGPADGVGRRGTCRRCTFHGSERAVVRVWEPEPSVQVRHFFFDDVRVEQTFEPSRLPALPGAPPGDPMVGIEVDAGEATLVRVHDAWVVDQIIPSTHELPADAGLRATGGSVLVDACTFHRRSGPRPSRPGLDNDPRYFDRPDGQDVFVDRRDGSNAMAHLTLLQVESQSWWMLGRRGGVDESGQQGPTLLLFAKHSNINAGFAPAVARLQRWRQADSMVPEVFDTRGLPSVVWATTNSPGAPMVLVASRFGGFVGLATSRAALDLGTTYGALDMDQPYFYLLTSAAFGFPLRARRPPMPSQNLTEQVSHPVPLVPVNTSLT